MNHQRNLNVAVLFRRVELGGSTSSSCRVVTLDFVIGREIFSVRIPIENTLLVLARTIDHGVVPGSLTRLREAGEQQAAASHVS